MSELPKLDLNASDQPYTPDLVEVFRAFVEGVGRMADGIVRSLVYLSRGFRSCGCLCAAHKGQAEGVCIGGDEPLRLLTLRNGRRITVCPPCHEAMRGKLRVLAGRS